MKNLFMIAGVSLIVTGCVANPAQERLKAYQQGQIFKGSFPIDDHVVPLPDGDWRYIASDFRRNDGNRLFSTTWLLNVVDGDVADAIQIKAALGGGGQGYVISAFCDRDDLIYKEVVNNERSEPQDCWGINYYRMTRGKDADKATIATLDYINDNKLKNTNMSPYVYHRFTKFGEYIEVIHATNPEYYSDIEKVPLTAWSASGWHIDQYHKDPKKAAFYDQMKIKGKAQHDEIRKGFYIK